MRPLGHENVIVNFRGFSRRYHQLFLRLLCVGYLNIFFVLFLSQA